MKLRLSTAGILRTPVFPCQANLKEVWHELKNYIHESSPEFYELIKDCSFEMLEMQEPKIRFTVWKYFNRAKFRATPYGNFAAISSIAMDQGSNSSAIIINKESVQHRFVNWKEKDQVIPSSKWQSNHATFLRTNTSVYLGAEEIRYIIVSDDAFELSAVGIEQTILKVLNYCRSRRSLKEVVAFFQQQSKTKAFSPNNLIEELISLQLLSTDYQPNIIGTDYFKRILPKTEKNRGDYIIAERKLLSGHIAEGDLQVLIEAVTFLHKHQEAPVNDFLKDFTSKFNHRYEGMKIPLLRVMDPEIGIDYRDLTQDITETWLIQELKDTVRHEGIIPKRYSSPLHQFILNEMIQQKNVQLEDYQGSEISKQLPLPNTLSLIVKHTDDHLVANSIGGCTANALLGRFSMASEEILATSRYIATIEEQANPDVILFDIAYQLEKNTDNINRRRSIYNYELPILCWSESEQIIDLSDVLVSVQNGEIILHSVKYGKRIVPRIASAYNYLRSDLSIYRFLSDLQYQGIHPSLGLDLQNVFPGLSHYERIAYKNVIISPEKWLVPKALCLQQSAEEMLFKVHDWLKLIGLDKPFVAGAGDQTLTFDPKSEEDLRSFLLFCKGKTTLYIEETFIPIKPVVKDDEGNGYLSEFVVNLEHAGQLYQPYQLPAHQSHPQVRNTYSPGEEWLYFEIYCRPTCSNAILMKLEHGFLPDIKKRLKRWFFIRYNQPAYHIRMRLHLIKTTDIGNITTALSELLAAEIHSGIISDLQLKTYRRETERYGASRMREVEDCFYKDSAFVMQLIKLESPIDILYQLSMTLLEDSCKAAGLSIETQLNFVSRMADNFAKELNSSPEAFKKINQAYKDFTIALAQAPIRLRWPKLQTTVNYFSKVLELCKDEEKPKILSDLFHMHVNRLFTNDQRMHEWIIYCYLTKRLKMKIGRAKQNI